MSSVREAFETSVNVPSPLLWKRWLGGALFGLDVGAAVGMAVDEDVEVRPAVPVVVERRGGRAVVVQGHARLPSHFLERAVAAVAIEEVRPEEVRDVQVGPAVVVVVERECADGFPVLARDAGLRGHVLEGPVAAVAVEPVAVAARRRRGPRGRPRRSRGPPLPAACARPGWERSSPRLAERLCGRARGRLSPRPPRRAARKPRPKATRRATRSRAARRGCRPPARGRRGPCRLPAGACRRARGRSIRGRGRSRDSDRGAGSRRGPVRCGSRMRSRGGSPRGDGATAPSRRSPTPASPRERPRARAVSGMGQARARPPAAARARRNPGSRRPGPRPRLSSLRGRPR